MNTFDLKQLSGITLPRLSAEVQELSDRSSEAGGELKALEYVLSGSRFAEQLLPRSFIFLLNRMYGTSVETLNAQLRRLTSMCEQFVQLYGDGPVSILRAPARINILGEHVDYVSYLPTASLPFGSREHNMLMLYRGSASGRVRGASWRSIKLGTYYTSELIKAAWASYGCCDAPSFSSLDFRRLSLFLKANA